MPVEFIELRYLVEIFIVIGAGVGVYTKAKKDGLNGTPVNGHRLQRPQIMSVESKEALAAFRLEDRKEKDKIWSEKTDVTLCDERYNNLSGQIEAVQEDTGEIKKDVKELLKNHD